MPGTVQDLVAAVKSSAGSSPISPPSGTEPTPDLDVGGETDKDNVSSQLVEEFRSAPPEDAAVALKELIRMYVKELAPAPEPGGMA